MRIIGLAVCLALAGSLSGVGDVIAAGAAPTTGAATGAGQGQYLLRTVRDDAGGVVVELWVESTVVDKLAEGAFDENYRLHTYRGSDGKVNVALYRDCKRSRFRANGFELDAPSGANMMGSFREDETHSMVVYQDENGKMRGCVVPILKSRGDVPAAGAAIASRALTEAESTGIRESLAANPNLPPNGGSATVGGSADAGANVNPDAPLSSHAAPRPSDPAGASSTPAGTPADPEAQVPPVPTPGNTYGFDPVGDDGDVEAAAQAEIARIRGSFQDKDGRSLDEWGVAVGANITHNVGIDGYRSPVHFWISTNDAVRSAVVKALAEKRKKLEDERAARVAEVAARNAQTAAGATSRSTPRPATTQPRPAATPAPTRASTPTAVPAPTKPPVTSNPVPATSSPTSGAATADPSAADVESENF